jgi:hypothetical protein
MLDLDNQIARLELRAEQMAIHLQQLGRNAPDASRSGRCRVRLASDKAGRRR